MKYGLPEYKALLEKNLRELRDPMSTPFGSDPFSAASVAVRIAKMESINYALEMLPDDPYPELTKQIEVFIAENEKHVDTIEKLEAEIEQLHAEIAGEDY